MVLRQGMALTLTGAAIGLACAAGASRLLGSLLFGVGTGRPGHVHRSGGAVLHDRRRRLLRAGAPPGSTRWKRYGSCELVCARRTTVTVNRDGYCFEWCTALCATTPLLSS